MKRFISIILFIACTISFFSCSEKFKVGAPYKEVMIVYGLLDLSDTAHYVKINRGFFDEENDNLVITKNKDSIYYDTLNVLISKMNSSNQVIQTYSMQKVSLKNEGIVKDTGIFLADPSYAYKLKQTLDPNFNYRISIINPKTGKEVKSTTSLLNTNQFAVDDLAGTIMDMSDASKELEFKFTPCANAAIVELYLRFHYYEVTTLAGGVEVGELKYKDLPIFKRLNATNGGGSPMIYTFQNNLKYGLIASGLGTAPNNVKRFVDTADILFFAGGTELKKYIDITNAQGGITADQIKPIYTNMEGENVYGLFSTRGKRDVNHLPFTQSTITDLMSKPEANGLGIAGKSPI